MRRNLTAALAAFLVAAPVSSVLAAPHMGGAMPAPMARSATAAVAPTSATTAPTNPNTRSGNAFGHPGAPAVSCQAIGVTPGNSSSSPGSPFNEPTATSAGGTAGQHYAGNVPQSQKNTASISQYDVACANAAAH